MNHHYSCVLGHASVLYNPQFRYIKTKRFSSELEKWSFRDLSIFRAELLTSKWRIIITLPLSLTQSLVITGFRLNWMNVLKYGLYQDHARRHTK
jgi:hypothetical protein